MRREFCQGWRQARIPSLTANQSCDTILIRENDQEFFGSYYLFPALRNPWWSLNPEGLGSTPLQVRKGVA